MSFPNSAINGQHGYQAEQQHRMAPIIPNGHESKALAPSQQVEGSHHVVNNDKIRQVQEPPFQPSIKWPCYVLVNEARKIGVEGSGDKQNVVARIKALER